MEAITKHNSASDAENKVSNNFAHTTQLKGKAGIIENKGLAAHSRKGSLNIKEQQTPPTSTKKQRVASVSEMLGVIKSHGFNNQLYKTPEAALDALLIKKTKAGSKSPNFGSKDIFLSKLNKLLDAERFKTQKLEAKLTLSEQQIEELQQETKTVKAKLDQANAKIQQLYLERVSTEDFQEICKSNQQLRDELADKESLLKECEELIAEFVNKQ